MTTSIWPSRTAAATAGRKVDPVAGEATLRCCSLSHSVFDLDGKVVKGPAKDPLKKYAVEQSGGDLVITL